jgi:hypothetical protein
LKNTHYKSHLKPWAHKMHTTFYGHHGRDHSPGGGHPSTPDRSARRSGDGRHGERRLGCGCDFGSFRKTGDGTLVGLDMADFDSIAVEHFCEYLRIRTVQPRPDYASCMEFLEKVTEQLFAVIRNDYFGLVDGCWAGFEMVCL